jgi:hypothetical protein
MSQLEQLQDLIKQAKQQNWPGSTLSFSQGVFSSNIMFASVTLGATMDEMPNRILQNDPLRVRFYIEQKASGEISVEPTMIIGRLKPESAMYAMSSEKVRTRKVTGSAEKVAQSIGKMLDKLRVRIEQLDNEDRFLDGLSYSISEKVCK